MKENSKSIIIFRASLIGYSLLFLLFLFGFHLQSNNPAEIIFLFLGPIFISLVGTFFLSKRKDCGFMRHYLRITAIPISLYIVIPLIASLLDHMDWINWSYFSYVMCVSSFLVVVPILHIIWNHFENKHCLEIGDLSSKHNKLDNEASKADFWALMMCFSVFVSGIYLFSYALMYHDKYMDNKKPGSYGLYMTNYNAEEQSEQQNGQQANYKNEQEKKSALIDYDCPSPGPDNYFHILFKSNSAEIQDIYTKTLLDATKKIKELGQDCSISVTLVGSTDDIPIVEDNNKKGLPAYRSNYELATARIASVRAYLNKNILPRNPEDWINIQWIENAKVNQTKCDPFQPPSQILFLFQFPIQTPDLFQFEDKKSHLDCKRVTIKVNKIPGHVLARQMNHMSHEEPPRKEKLDLIDYIYFATYTVTTTGYGDIVPVTSYAKFITILANLYEVLFLVIFINALISMNRNDKKIVPTSPVDQQNAGKQVEEKERHPDEDDGQSHVPSPG